MASAVISAFVMHGDTVRVVAETGEELGPTSAGEDARMTPGMWASAINLAEDYQARLETIEHVRSVRARIMRMAQQDRKYIKQGKTVIESQQRELLQAQKQHDAAAQGQLEYFIKKNTTEIGEYENRLAAHMGMLAQCDDILQRI